MVNSVYAHILFVAALVVLAAVADGTNYRRMSSAKPHPRNRVLLKKKDSKIWDPNIFVRRTE